MLDPAVADAAFALEQGASSAPVAGRFGPVLVRVTQIQPEAVRPFEEVAAELRQELARQRAQGRDRDGSTTRSRICAPAPSRWPISPRRRA